MRQVSDLDMKEKFKPCATGRTWSQLNLVCRSAHSQTFRIIQLLPEDPRIVPPSRCHVDIEMARYLFLVKTHIIDINEMKTYIVAIHTMIGNEDLDLLRSSLLIRSTRGPTRRVIRMAFAVRRTGMHDAIT